MVKLSTCDDNYIRRKTSLLLYNLSYYQIASIPHYNIFNGWNFK